MTRFHISLAFVIFALGFQSAGAQVVTPEYPYAAESREERAARLEAARRRVDEYRARAKARRGVPRSYEELVKERELREWERVLTDPSLQPGDIFSTSKGIFVFKGRSDVERRREDFVPLPAQEQHRFLLR